jgi:hypothetical protein
MCRLDSSGLSLAHAILVLYLSQTKRQKFVLYSSLRFSSNEYNL